MAKTNFTLDERICEIEKRGTMILTALFGTSDKTMARRKREGKIEYLKQNLRGVRYYYDKYQEYIIAEKPHLAKFTLQEAARGYANKYHKYFLCRTYDNAGMRYADWSCDEILNELKSLEQHISSELNELLLEK